MCNAKVRLHKSDPPDNARASCTGLPIWHVKALVCGKVYWSVFKVCNLECFDGMCLVFLSWVLMWSNIYLEFFLWIFVDFINI